MILIQKLFDINFNFLINTIYLCPFVMCYNTYKKSNCVCDSSAITHFIVFIDLVNDGVELYFILIWI